MTTPNLPDEVPPPPPLQDDPSIGEWFGREPNGEPKRVYPASWLEVAVYALCGAVVGVGLVVLLVQAVKP